jgi:hypothetical protein
MAGFPLKIAVYTDEPYHASYLESVLRMELPGQFRVHQWGLKDVGAEAATPGAGAADLVVLQADPGAVGNVHALGKLARQAKRPPILVFARGMLELSTLERLIFDGADDVLDLAQLNTRALAAAVIKAVRRHARAFRAAAGAPNSLHLANVD